MTERVRGGGRFRSGWRVAGWSIGAALVALPLLAMQVTDEVNWSPADFLLAGALVLGVGGALEVAARRVGSGAYRAALAVALAAALVLVWANGAVGILGSEDNPANRMFGAVLAVALVGAGLARFRPRGMAGAMVAAALAQVLVPVIALVAGPGEAGAGWPWDVSFATAFLAALWLASAALFRKAARDEAPTGAGA